MASPLAETSWWWTALSGLEPDALLQYALGELQLAGADEKAFQHYLDADPDLRVLLVDFAKDIGAVRDLETAPAATPWWELLTMKREVHDWVRTRVGALQRLVTFLPGQLQVAYAVADAPVLGGRDQAYHLSLMPYFAPLGLDAHFSEIDLRFVTEKQTHVFLRMVPRAPLPPSPNPIEFAVELSGSGRRPLGTVRLQLGGGVSPSLIIPRLLDPQTFTGTARISIREIPRSGDDVDE